MTITDRFREKLTGLRIDRSLRLAFGLAPAHTIIFWGLLICQALLPVASLVLIKLIIDRIVLLSGHSGYEIFIREVGPLVGIACIIALLIALGQQSMGWLREVLARKISDGILTNIHEKSAEIDLEKYENPVFYDTLFRAQQEGPYRPAGMINNLGRILQNSIAIVAVAGLVFSVHWSIPFVIVFSVIPGILVRLRFSEILYRWHREITPVQRETDYLHWLLTGKEHAKEIRIFDTGRFFSEKFRTLRKIYGDSRLALSRRKALAAFVAEGVSIAAVFCVFGFMGARVVSGDMTIGDLVMIYQAIQQGIRISGDLLTGLSEIYEDNRFIEDYYDLVDQQITIRSPEHPLPVPALERSVIQFENVSFGYNPGRMLSLQNISFSIQPGEIVAFIGANGAGKTTLVKLLCRFYDPQNGVIRVGGTDIRLFDPLHFRKEMSVVFQDYVKYNLTASENIGFSDVDSSRVELAAQRTGADRILKPFPEYLDTLLGTRFRGGEALSAGQWQKIAITRAFYKDAGLYIFDEPAASLDTESEHELFRQIRTFLKGKSAILISHRYSTIKMADRIFVLDNGRLVESGSHDSLIQVGGIYTNWYEAQAKDFK